MTEWVFVWTGGAVFVASLALCAVSYLWTWSGVAGAGWTALSVDAVLVGIFATHHSVFARESVKRWLARHVPEHLLRSVYVWTASLLFLGTCAAWRPIGHQLFQVSGGQVWLHAAIQLLGVGLIARVVRGLDPLELAGIRQWRLERHPSAVGRRPSTVDYPLSTDGPYRLVRHPLYLGWILIVFGTANMTGDRLAFAVLTTVYLAMAIPWEERSLVQTYGDEYRRYQRLVRWRLIPFIY